MTARISALDDAERVQHSTSRPENAVCEPIVQIPAWWSGFLFHVLNPRQISMYVYLIMLTDERGICHPTIEEIRKDLGLLSTTMVFESIAVLEEYGFFVRSRQALPESRSRRNVYRRTACEYTILRLLETNKIDSEMRPLGAPEPASDEAKDLVQDGLRRMLCEHFGRYSAASPHARRDALIAVLHEMLKARRAGIYLY
jgi:hypothetical protein